VSEQQNGQGPAESAPEPARRPEAGNDPLLEAAIDAGLAGDLSWMRVGAVVGHLVEHDWIAEHSDPEAEAC
jgi:hypothetical protein